MVVGPHAEQGPIVRHEQSGRVALIRLFGGEVDLHRAAELLLRELRSGKIGRVSLERPSELTERSAAADQ